MHCSDVFSGDFAVLLRAGMSVKQALVYNCVSSVLCLFGMVVGVLAGNVGSVSLWIFALTGGMFIYIALVDMVSDQLPIYKSAWCKTSPGCPALAVSTTGRL